MKHCWNVSVSPRSPAKIEPELLALSAFDGALNNRDFQERFTEVLASLDDFRGDGSDDNKSFSARDRIAPMQTYGFVFIDDDDVIHLTPAGWALINARSKIEREEIWLRQLLKWQFPSPQHKNRQYIRDDGMFGVSGFDVKPFLATLEMISLVGGMTKFELAMFALTKIDMVAIPKWCSAIEAYRKILESRPAGNDRKQFSFAALTMLYEERRKIFNPAKTPKQASAMDYADALRRLLRMTGLVTFSKGRIIIAPERAGDVKAILQTKWPLRYNWDDSEAFYEYFGDPQEPHLPWQDTEALRGRVLALYDRAHSDLGAATFAVPRSAVELLPTQEEIKDASNAELLSQYERATDALMQIKVTGMLGTLRSVDGIHEVREFFDTVQRKGDPLIFDPPSQLEWNCWRAMLALDHTDNVQANQTMDTNLQPMTRAPGNGPDGIAYFDSFDVILEPTLKTGSKQWNDESEPIYRHAVNHTNAVRATGDSRDIYTLAIAPKILPDVAAYFLNAAKGLMPIPSMLEPPLIVPMTITQIQELLDCAATVNGFRPDEIWILFERIKDGLAKVSAGDSVGYFELIQTSIEETIAEALSARPGPVICLVGA